MIKKTPNFKAHRKTFFVFMMFCIALFMVNFSSAVTDKSFDKDIGKYGKVELTNRAWIDVFGWFEKPIERIELKENTDSCGSDCYAIKDIELLETGKLVDSVYFKTPQGSTKELDYDFYIKVGEIEKEKDIFKEQCSNGKVVSNNGSSIRSCKNVFFEKSKTIESVWQKYNYEEMSPGNYTLKLEAKKDPYESIDWIITSQGREIVDWAWWIGVQPSAYYPMNYSLNDYSGNNLTLTGGASNTFSDIYKIANGSRDYRVGGDQDTVTDQLFNFSTGNFTFAYWINTTTTNGAFIGTASNFIDNGGWAMRFNGGLLKFEKSSNIILSVSQVGINDDGDWHRIVVTRNDSGLALFVDGTLSDQNTTDISDFYRNDFHIGSIGGAGALNGLVDELLIYKGFAWNTSDVTEDYNGGAGMIPGEVDQPSGITVTLDSPLDSVFLSNSTQFFNGTIIPTNFNLTNASLFIWDNEDNLFNYSVNLVTGNVTNTTSFQVDDFVAGDYHWNIFGCGINTTSTLCNYAANNFTFTWRPFEINSLSFTGSVDETSFQTFNLSINTIAEVLNVVSTLNYNGTDYAGTTSCEAGVCDIYSQIDIPLNLQETENRTLFWKLSVYDGENTFLFNTSDQDTGQEVSKIHLENCNATYTVNSLNFTAYNEQNLSRINPFNFASTLNIWLGQGGVKRSSSFQNISTAEVDFCISPSQNYNIDGQVDYSFSDQNNTFVQRNYFFQNNTVNSTRQDISLYLLNAEDSTSFILKVQDQKLSPIVNAIIYIQRYYPSDGTYKTVQVAETDENGKSVGFFQTETVDYRFIIMKDGETLLVTDKQKVVGEEVPFTLTFTIGEAAPLPWSIFEKNETITSSLTYSKSTSTVTYTYIDPTGSTSLGRLLVIQENNNNNTVTVICNVTSPQSAATLTCDTSSYDGTGIAYGYLDDYNLTDLLNFLITNAREIFGNTGLFVSLFIIMVSGFAFIWNPSAGIIAVNISVMALNLIGFLSMSPVFIFSMIFISFITIILLKT